MGFSFRLFHRRTPPTAQHDSIASCPSGLCYKASNTKTCEADRPMRPLHTWRSHSRHITIPTNDFSQIDLFGSLHGFESGSRHGVFPLLLLLPLLLLTRPFRRCGGGGGDNSVTERQRLCYDQNAGTVCRRDTSNLLIVPSKSSV